MAARKGSSKDGQGRRGTGPKSARQDPPPARSEPAPGGLIKPGGKVDPGAIWRAAHAGDEPRPTPSGTAGDRGRRDQRPASDQTPSCAAPSDDEAELEGLEDDEDLLTDPALAGGANPGESGATAEGTGTDGPAMPATAAGMPPKVTFTPQRDLDKRLDKYLCDRITFMSRSKLQALIESGGVLVNGRVAKSSTPVHAGDVIEVSVPPPPSEDFPPEDIPLDVLFEDEHLIVLNKQAGLIVHPARTHTRGTMINALAFYFRHRSASGGSLSSVGSRFARPGVVHRLDRHTSGLIVFAKSEQAHWKLADQFMRRTVDKRYVAVVEGEVQPIIDVIDEPLGPHPSRMRGYREKHVVRHDHLGKPAVTVYRVLGHYARPTDPGGAELAKCSLVEVELKTGRTHQIRVHFSHRGFPLIGDDMYGGKALPLPDGPPFDRQALHAAYLAFRHPISGQPMTFRAPAPADLARLLKAVRGWPTANEFPSPPGSMLGLTGVGDLLSRPG
jgi:23S rRNA pseudouridine1911/1915/1917 synthase